MAVGPSLFLAHSELLASRLRAEEAAGDAAAALSDLVAADEALPAPRARWGAPKERLSVLGRLGARIDAWLSARGLQSGRASAAPPSPAERLATPRSLLLRRASRAARRAVSLGRVALWALFVSFAVFVLLSELALALHFFRDALPPASPLAGGGAGSSSSPSSSNSSVAASEASPSD